MWHVIVEGERQRRARRRLLLLGAVASAGALWVTTRDVCLSWWWRGYDVPACPEGRVRQVTRLEADALRRGSPGSVTVHAEASWVAGTRFGVLHPVPQSVVLSLVGADGTQHPVSFEPARREAPAWTGRVTLPDVPDGDWRLRAIVTTDLGVSTAEAPLALYAPASVHVLTDRPLYEPGNLVKFRAVALRVKDLSPLDGRPGAWRVYDPSGELVFEEKAPAGPWGVVAGTFPLDDGAPTGEWRVEWASGGTSGSSTITVEPFTLPRFRVEVTPDRPFHRAGQRPVLRGRVVYSSGAPVAGAKLEVRWGVDGVWPPPASWLERDLPKTAPVDASGAFVLTLPQVPPDLRGRVTLRASVVATDAAGERLATGVGVLLSEDALQASVVTELEGGLVGGSNNRVFVRVSDPAGTPLPGASVRVRRAWDPRDPGVVAVADEDAVAAFQLDPGPPVNVVVPPMPWRAPPPVPVVQRGEAWDLVADEGASLADQRAMDQWLPALEPCGRFVDGEEELVLGLRAEAGGAVSAVAVQEESPAGACVADVLRRQRLPPASARVLRASFTVRRWQRPSLVAEVSAVDVQPELLDAVLARAAADASSCLPQDDREGRVALAASWSVKARWRAVEVAWTPADGDHSLPPGAVECVKARFRGLLLPEESDFDALGLVRFDVVVPEDETGQRPKATTFLGYELLVSVLDGETERGSTKVRVRPGEVPALRLRASPVLAKGGDTVTVELVRGPGFAGELPEKLRLRDARRFVEAKVDRDARKVAFTLPKDAEGWWSVSHDGAAARVFVDGAAALAVEVTPAKESYRPGDTAALAVSTSANGRPVPAAVGLFGVDGSLAQLATLPGPDALEAVRPRVPMVREAFPGLDAQALTMGRVRGANAAAAVVAGAGEVAFAAEEDAPVSTSAATPFDPDAEITDAFFSVLGSLHVRVRRWQADAPAGELMTPAMMASFWRDSVADTDQQGNPARDAFGRPLALRQLPEDLLALVDPRVVVTDGTRLPEDVESWTAFVMQEVP